MHRVVAEVDAMAGALRTLRTARDRYDAGIIRQHVVSRFASSLVTERVYTLYQEVAASSSR